MLKIKASIKINLTASILALLMFSSLCLGILSVVKSSKSINNIIDFTMTSKIESDINSAHLYLEKHFNEISYREGVLFDSNGKEIEGRNEMVDEIQKYLGDAATIFVKKGDDFERISTNIVNSEGTRAIGTLLGKDSDAYSDMVNGKRYVGTADILGKNYITAYDPILDESGQIVGVLFIGVPKSEAIELANRFSAELRNQIMSVALIVLIIGTIVAFYIGNSLSRPIVDLAGIIADGDYTRNIPEKFIKKKDELGDFAGAIEKMQKEVKLLMLTVRNSSKELLTSSDALSQMSKQSAETTSEITKAINQVAEGAAMQAESLEKSVNSVNNLADRIEEVSKSVLQMDQMSVGISELNSSGLEKVKILDGKANATRQSVMQIEGIIIGINDASERIGTIIDAITYISRQTNLLALNAAIEAARAGEHGRGFSVVADEIRNLAEQSSKESENIKSLIDDVQKQVKEAVIAVNETSSVLQEQDRAVIENENIFFEISKSIELIRKKVLHMDKNTEEMGKSKNEIVGMIETIAAGEEESSASTEEVSASTEQLLAAMELVSESAVNTRNMAQNLQVGLSKFKIE
ncbi:methyl-accepting chemotaxis protein [Peptoclostridium litorale DSM 5388]|uniref:Methyl-accepting chemotaxis protein TlpC n=1 Tax=Peptoclostridium litorale DSM 5388 TaxID=1121324 RepID=A0A069RH40_PEPLI|nr:Cache 3/Cache 2 fusion domain-containing protein [Peptoclostridium litorale]KDR96326.1 methyl-accepting chemotaxis protein TlpC [Peptoclostridium litorale DSM 5388]SIO26418.1 methyl-accepting chemotaxis protein [Peptoclostridium litorale DSM 5388]